MKFSTNEDVEAPIDAVFAMLSDFDHFERVAMRRGAEVLRAETEPGHVNGTLWNAMFDWRGKRRAIQVKLLRYDRPQQMVFDSRMEGLTGELSVELIALSRLRTRMRIVLDVKPETMKARLLVQSMRLAKATLNKRYKGRISDYAGAMEERYGRMA